MVGIRFICRFWNGDSITDLTLMIFNFCKKLTWYFSACFRIKDHKFSSRQQNSTFEVSLHDLTPRGYFASGNLNPRGLLCSGQSESPGGYYAPGNLIWLPGEYFAPGNLIWLPGGYYALANLTPESNSVDKLWPRVHLGLASFSRVTLS